MLEDGARLRLTLPFARKGEISLKKIGLELVVGVDGQRRTIMLPSALAALQPTGATFEDGALEVSFDGARDPTPDPRRRRSRARLGRGARCGGSSSGSTAPQEAAERLIGGGGRGWPAGRRRARRRSARRTGKPPPAGWQVRRGDAATRRPASSSRSSQLLQALRDLIPPELQRRLAEALRELLLALRALIDWYLERLGAPARASRARFRTSRSCSLRTARRAARLRPARGRLAGHERRAPTAAGCRRSAWARARPGSCGRWRAPAARAPAGRVRGDRPVPDPVPALVPGDGDRPGQERHAAVGERLDHRLGRVLVRRGGGAAGRGRRADAAVPAGRGPGLPPAGRRRLGDHGRRRCGPAC